jgi:nitroimidazol reductase NimA-like FMN-containing flavoprotein (pyridoxamine 5'-phosphate oxidase superfamily)
MSDEEIGSFLARRGHGVLSFAGEVPYGLPVSLGYDVVNERVIFQLLGAEDGVSRRFVGGEPRRVRVRGRRRVA